MVGGGVRWVGYDGWVVVLGRWVCGVGGGVQWQIQDFLKPGAWIFVLNNEVHFGHKKTVAFTVVNPACINKSEFC